MIYHTQGGIEAQAMNIEYPDEFTLMAASRRNGLSEEALSWLGLRHTVGENKALPEPVWTRRRGMSSIGYDYPVNSVCFLRFCFLCGGSF